MFCHKFSELQIQCCLPASDITENEPYSGEFSQFFVKTCEQGTLFAVLCQDLRTGYPVRKYSAFAELKLRIIANAETVKQILIANADFFLDD